MGLSNEQKLIVDAPSGNILVSAAAGSGKTTVMTERIVKRILDRELSVENVLVMTFTNAAAANMSAKLEKKLREKLSETTDKETRKYLSEQIAALPSAYISTIDSFCSRVISNFSAQSRDENGNLLLEPKSMILDEVHATKLLNEAFSEVFSVFAMGLRLFGNMLSGVMFAGILSAFIPFIAPLTMQTLGLLTGTIQAYIFALLALVYTLSVREDNV